MTETVAAGVLVGGSDVSSPELQPARTKPAVRTPRNSIPRLMALPPALSLYAILETEGYSLGVEGSRCSAAGNLKMTVFRR